MAEGMLTQESVNYRPAEATSNCGNCKFYDGTACMYVEPPITAEDLCDLHQQKEVAATTGLEEMMSEDVGMLL